MLHMYRFECAEFRCGLRLRSQGGLYLNTPPRCQDYSLASLNQPIFLLRAKHVVHIVFGITADLAKLSPVQELER